MESFQFTKRTIVITAMTGVAATLLLGKTAHSAMILNQKKPLQPEQIEIWNETRLVVIDEISFASASVFKKVHERLRILKQCLHLPYGGLDIIFSGDLRQLEPIGGDAYPIYQVPCMEFNDWINCYIDLFGKYRFINDPEWGETLF